MTSPWTARQIQVIDERVARAVTRMTDVGAVTSVSTDRQRAMVTMESATVAVPCKVAGGCWCEPGDKVGVTRYGADWYVTDVLNRVAGPPLGGWGAASPGGSTTSGTPVNLPGDPSFQFLKRWDTTPILMGFGLSFYISGAAAGIVVSLRFAGPTTVTYPIWQEEPSDQLNRYGWCHFRPIPDSVTTAPLPAGLYTVNLQWHRGDGSGTIVTNSDDWQSAFVIEGGN